MKLIASAKSLGHQKTKLHSPPRARSPKNRSLSPREATEEKQPETAATFTAPVPSPFELRRSEIMAPPRCWSRYPGMLLCAWHGTRWLSRGGSRHCGLCGDRTFGGHEILLEHPAALSRIGIGDLDPAVLSADDL